MDPYRKLAAELILGAAVDFHAFWNTTVRRSAILRSIRAKRGKVTRKTLDRIQERCERRLQLHAAEAEDWMMGCEAPMPFDLCAHALGWDEYVLRDRIMSNSTGLNLEA